MSASGVKDVGKGGLVTSGKISRINKINWVPVPCRCVGKSMGLCSTFAFYDKKVVLVTDVGMLLPS